MGCIHIFRPTHIVTRCLRASSFPEHDGHHDNRTTSCAPSSRERNAGRAASVGQRTQRFAYSEARRAYIPSSIFIADESEPRSESVDTRRPTSPRAFTSLELIPAFLYRSTAPVAHATRRACAHANHLRPTGLVLGGAMRANAAVRLFGGTTSLHFITAHLADESEPRSESADTRRPASPRAFTSLEPIPTLSIQLHNAGRLRD